MLKANHIQSGKFCREVKGRTFVSRLKRIALLTFAFLMLENLYVKAGNETFSSGAFIINMGVTPQTVNNGLKPYGLIYQLIKSYDVSVKWVIGQSKVKDGIDFTYNAIAYRGGTFIIPAEFRTAAVNTVIANWQAQGVVGVTTTTSIVLDVTFTLRAAPYWAMDAANGDKGIAILTRAGIPSSAYYFRTPATLNACDDLYIMPHADPKWSTHSNLYYWNKNAKGAIWGGCHAVSAMEGPNCVNPSNPSESLKFLSTGGLVLWGSHNDGSPPYSYQYFNDPVFQFMGTEDGAHTNGSEQIYLPIKGTSTWNPSVKIGCYDPTQQDVPSLSDGPAAVTLYGYAFNDTTRGVVMYEAGHDIGGTSSDEVAAQRIFLNWSFIGASRKEPIVSYVNVPSSLNSGQTYNNFTANASSPVGLTSFTYQWYSSLGGTFSNPNSSVTNYTAPLIGAPTTAIFYCKVTEPCGRYTINAVYATFYPVPTAPFTTNDTISFPALCSAIPTTINVLANDWDINNNMINSISFIGGGNYGTFVNNGNGSITYNPGPLFVGNDTMRYQVCDSTALCSQATIVIKTGYSGACSIPMFLTQDTTLADTVQMSLSIGTPNNALGLPNATNGSNVNTAMFNNVSDSMIVRLVSPINTGDTVIIHASADNNNCIDWTVQGALTAGGFVNGVNSFNLTTAASTSKIYNNYLVSVTGPTQYIKIKIRSTACDDNLNVDAVYSVRTTCLSAVPIANGETVNTGKNTSVTTNVRINDFDPQYSTLSVSILNGPSHGIANVNGAGNIVYTPTNGYTGSDQIIYKLCNVSCLCDTAILSLNVQTNPCAINQVGTFISSHATGVFSSSNVTNPTSAIGISDETNGSNANSAKINNVIGANIILDLTDTVPAGDTIIVRAAPDNNTANTFKVEGNLTSSFASPTTTTNFNLPGSTSKIYEDYLFILSGPTRFIKISQITTTANVDVDALRFDFWKCTNIPNRAPSAIDDTITTRANWQAIRNVVTNDSDPDGNALTASIITPAAAHGIANIAGNVITYTPNFGYTGLDTVTYKVCDNGVPSLCDTGLFIITVVYGPPVAMKDNSSTNSGTAVNINVQANDTLAVTGYVYTTSLAPLILPPTNGSAVLIGNNIQYTPNAGFTGKDSLVYYLCDNAATPGCDTAIVYINVNNQAPTANADVGTTTACNSIILNVISNDTDPEGGALTITSVSAPANGSAVISNNKIVYTPSSSPVFTGVENFTYTVCDNGVTPLCAVGNVSVTVNMGAPVASPPVAMNDYDSTFIGQNLYINVLANDMDPEEDTIRVDSTAGGLLAPLMGTIQYLSNNLILYVPTPGATGVDSFEYRVCDVHNSGVGCINIVPGCAIAKVYVTIKNRPPAANDDHFYTITTINISNSLASFDYEPDGQPMSFSVLSPPSNGVFNLNPDGNFTYIPDGIYIGDVFITYIVCDNGVPSLCDTAVVTISVAMTNVSPNAQPDTITSYGVSPVNGDLSTNDSDPNGNMDPNSYTILTNTTNGIFVLNPNGTFTYTANAGYVGYDYVYYEVCDSGSPQLCSQAWLTITVVDIPPVTFNQSPTLYEDSANVVPPGSGILANGDYDPNGGTLSVDTVPLVGPSNGSVVLQPNGGYTYTPNPNFFGSDFFVVNVCDSSPYSYSQCTADTVFITVLNRNDFPSPSNDTLIAFEDSVYNGNVSLNDIDIDGDNLTYSLLTPPANGNLVFNANGTFTYTPDPDYNGPDQFDYTACDDGVPVMCSTASVYLTVTPTNDPPVATDDYAATNPTVPITLDVLLNDYDIDGDSMFVTVIGFPTNGGIVNNGDGTLTYTGNIGFLTGLDTVVYQVCDNGIPTMCDTAIWVINVPFSNLPPNAVNDFRTTPEDTPKDINVTANDQDGNGDTLIITGISTPLHGTAILDTITGHILYTPDPNYNGPDQFTYIVCDDDTVPLCDTAVVTISVTPVNDPPVIVNDTLIVIEDVAIGGSVINANDYDPDTTALSANTTPVLAPAHGMIVINSNGTYTYTPATNYNGPDMVVISICDAGRPFPSICRNDTLFITVTPVNDPPVIVNNTASTNEDVPVSGNVITVADYDPDTTALTANTIPVFGPNNGIIIVAANGAYTYTPNLNFNGLDTVVISICDSGTPLPSICRNDTLFITVNPVNDPPIVTNDNFNTNEDTPVGGNVITGGETDPDGTALTVNTTPVVNASNGIFVINGAGTFTYTPNLNFNGIDTIVVSVCDGGTPLPAICLHDTIFITVNPVNDPPVIANDAISVNEDSFVSGTIITAGDSDPDGTVLTADSLSVIGPSNGIFVINSNGSYTYTPAPDFNGIDTVIVAICDNGIPLPVACVNDTLIITVNPVNDAPVIINSSNTTFEDTAVSGSVIGPGEYDPDGTLLQADPAPVYGPINGNINIINDGSYTYTPNPDFYGVDTIIIAICDNGVPLPAICVNDTLIITVLPVNDAPVIANENVTTNENTPVSGSILDAADYDIEGTTLSVDTTPISGPFNGIITINSLGNFTYTPNLNFNGIDTVVFAVCDSGYPMPALCVNDTLFINVNMVNTPPVISNDAYVTNEETPVSGTVLTGADFDPDLTTLTADTIPVYGPNHGIISISPNGNFTYTPNADYYGIDTIIIAICDSGLPLPAICVNDTLIITVNPVNDAPVANNDYVDLCINGTLQIDALSNDTDIDMDSLYISAIVQPANGSASTDGLTISYTPAPGFSGSDSISYTVCDTAAAQQCVNGMIYIDVHGITGTGIIASEVLCFGGSTGSVSTTPVGTAPFTYSWNTGATTQNITSLIAGFYSVTITDSLGCSINDTATVSQPAAALSLTPSFTDVSCYGDSTGTASVVVTGGTMPYNYQWSEGSTTQNIATLPAGSYSLIVTDALGCIDSITVTVTGPTYPISISATTMDANCLNGTNGAIDATATGGTIGYSYSWSNGQTTEDITDVAGTYTIVVTDANACVDSAAFVIAEASAVSIATSDAITFCAGDSALLTTSAPGPYQWNLGGSPIAGATSNQYSATQSGDYTISINNSCGSYTSNQITVTVNPLPVLSVSGATEICEGSSTQLTASGSTAYSWNPSTSLNNPVVNNPVASPLVTTTYTVTGFNGGCAANAQFTLIVHPLPVVTASATPFDCVIGSQLNATGGVSYTWSPLTGLDFSTISNPVANPATTTSYMVTAIDSFLCVNTAIVTVLVDCDSLGIPSGISPDGDGVNDTWIIDGIQHFPGNRLGIYNRWGNIVYSAQPYTNDWSGTCNTGGLRAGEQLPEGTYYYILETGTTVPPKIGYVEIRR